MTRKPAKAKKATKAQKSKKEDVDNKSALDCGLYIVSTPIGNLADITYRAVEVLKNCDMILCEDRRVTQKLLNTYSIKSRMMTYHEHNAEKQRPKIIEKLQDGQSLALVTDAGTPLISDPGYKLVEAVRAEKFDVFPVPGASSLLAALVGSALPTDRFMFAGFMPPKKSARQAKLSGLAQLDMTLIFFETAKRLRAFLDDAALVMGNRDVVVARELTKKFEEFIPGKVEDVLHKLEDEGDVKGEVVVIIGAAKGDNKERYTDDELDDLLGNALGDLGMSVRDAASYVAEETGIQKRKLYARALALTHAGRSDLG